MSKYRQSDQLAQDVEKDFCILLPHYKDIGVARAMMRYYIQLSCNNMNDCAKNMHEMLAIIKYKDINDRLIFTMQQLILKKIIEPDYYLAQMQEDQLDIIPENPLDSSCSLDSDSEIIHAKSSYNVECAIDYKQSLDMYNPDTE
ncbi:MAG: hypothetical protein AB8B67_04465 [Rickettsiaceae bacterium]